MLKILFTILFATVSLASAQEGRKCTNASLRGDYAFELSGTRPSGPPPAALEQIVGVTRRSFDGYGGAIQTDYIQGSISGYASRSGTGAYSVNEDCTGSITLINAGAPPLEGRFVIVDAGKEVWLVITSPLGITVRAKGKKI